MSLHMCAMSNGALGTVSTLDFLPSHTQDFHMYLRQICAHFIARVSHHFTAAFPAHCDHSKSAANSEKK